MLVRLLKYHRERSLELKVYILCFRDVTVITQDDELKVCIYYGIGLPCTFWVHESVIFACLILIYPLYACSQCVYVGRSVRTKPHSMT